MEDLPWARPRLAGSGCRASHRAASRLDLGGRPSLAQRGQAGCAGGHHEGGPSRGRGSRALVSVAGTRPTGPLDELARCSRTVLRSTALRSALCAAHVPDRHPGHPPRPEPGSVNAKRARDGSTAAPVAALGGTPAAEAPVLDDVGGPLAAAVAPAAPSRRPRWLGPSWIRVSQPWPDQPTALPPAAPPSTGEGDLWGDLQCGGPGDRLTVSAADEQPNAPPPARPRGAGARESEREDQFSGTRTPGPAGRISFG